MLHQLEQQLQERRRLYARSAEAVDQPELLKSLREQLLEALEGLGQHLLTENRAAEAMPYFEELLSWRQMLYVDSRAGKNLMETLKFGTAFAKVGDAQTRLGEHDEAERSYSACVGLLGMLYEDTHRSDVLLLFCIALSQQADNFVHQEQLHRAEEFYRESARLLDLLYEKLPSLQTLGALAYARYRLGTTLKLLDSPRQARAELEAALSAYVALEHHSEDSYDAWIERVQEEL